MTDLNRRQFIKKLTAGIAAIPFAPKLLFASTSPTKQIKTNKQLHVLVKGPKYDNKICKLYGKGVIPEIEDGLKANDYDFISIGDNDGSDISIDDVTNGLKTALEDPKHKNKEIIIHHLTHGDIDKKTGKHGIILTNQQMDNQEDLTPTSDYLKAIDNLLTLHGKKTKIIMTSCFGNKAQEDAPECLSEGAELLTTSDNGVDKISLVNSYRELQSGAYKGKSFGPLEFAAITCISSASTNPLDDEMQLQIIDKNNGDGLISFHELTEQAATNGNPKTDALTNELLAPYFGKNLTYLTDAATNTNHKRLNSFYLTKLPLVGAIKSGNQPMIQALQNLKPETLRTEIINDPMWDEYTYPIIERDEEGKHCLTFEKIAGKNKGEKSTFALPDLHDPKYNADFLEVSNDGTVIQYTYSSNQIFYDFKTGKENRGDIGLIKAVNDEIILNGFIKSSGDVNFDVLEKNSDKYYSLTGNVSGSNMCNTFDGSEMVGRCKCGNCDIIITEFNPRKYPLEDYNNPQSHPLIQKIKHTGEKLKETALNAGLLSAETTASPKPEATEINGSANPNTISRRDFLQLVTGKGCR